MSGICGLVDLEDGPIDDAVLQAMAEAAAHRGPDGIRHRIRGNAGFTHLALDITPESFREEQPLIHAQDNLILTADARVDNRADLICTLSASGHVIENDPTDADLLLAAYRRWGSGCPEHIIGDFAFAIWDGERRRLFAARDPMAMRPFYYRVEPRRLLFASEVKQILAAPNVPARIFEPAVAAHLAGWFDPLHWTSYEGIAQLPPGHILSADAGGHRVRRYWEIDPEFRIQYSSDAEYAEHLLELFQEAVRCRLRSNKPVGILLSGGMDSGSIASTAGLLLQRKNVSCPAFHAYCYAFHKLKQCDERHISEGIVRHYGFPVTDIPAEEAWPLKGYPEHGPDRDEPYIGVYQALLETTMETARSQGVALLLSGDRGDLMAGENIYDYLGLFWKGHWKVLIDELRTRSRRSGRPLSRTVKYLLLRPLARSVWPPRRAAWLGPLHRSVYRTLYPLPVSPPWLPPSLLERTGVREMIRQAELLRNMRGRDNAREQRYRAVFTEMHVRGMVWSDRTQARFGLGFADPWSDQRIARFVLAAPQRVLNTTGAEKRLVRLAMKGVMPEEARQNARKISPGPLYLWAFRERSRDTILDLITNSKAAAMGYIDKSALLEHYESIRQGGRDLPGFWWALTLEMWLRRYWS